MVVVGEQAISEGISNQWNIFFILLKKVNVIALLTENRLPIVATVVDVVMVAVV